MSEQKKYKYLAVGTESFSKLINEECYFVDKTPFIKTIFAEEKSSVLLFTRPRRFGKTLFMKMLADFLRINKDNPDDKEKTKALFKETAIIKDKEFTDKFLGNFPVINISLKSINADTYKEAYNDLCDIVIKLASDLKYLLDSDNVPDEYKNKLRKWLFVHICG